MKNIIHHTPPVKAYRVMSDGTRAPISVIAEYTDTDGVVYTYKSRRIGSGAVHHSKISINPPKVAS